MMKKILAAALALVMLAGCSVTQGIKVPSSSSSVAPESLPEPEFPITVGDVTISSEPQKIVSLSPGLTEIVCALGYEDKLAGISDACDYPDGIDAFARCGSPLALNKQELVALQPDLVLSSIPLTELDLIWFQQSGIPVLVLERASDFDALEDLYLDTGMALGGQTTGRKAARELYDMLADILEEATALCDAYRANNQKLVHAILLREMSYSMATGDTFEQKIFDYLGITNDAKNYGDWLFLEADLKNLNPDIIFCDESIDPAAVAKSYEYSTVPAAKNDMIMQVPISAFERQSPRMFYAILDMADFAFGTDAAE